jgi:hypothetical protein
MTANSGLSAATAPPSLPPAPSSKGKTRAAKSLRQTGISLRLDLGPNPDYRDIAKWARTSPTMIASFYDQTHPQQSVERIAGFRKDTTSRQTPRRS